MVHRNEPGQNLHIEDPLEEKWIGQNSAQLRVDAEDLGPHWVS